MLKSILAIAASKRTWAFGVLLIALVAAALVMSCSPDPKGKPDYSPEALDLAREYAPVLYSVKQTSSCDNTFDTDPYNPTSVDAFLDKDNVRLMGKGVKVRPLVGDVAVAGNGDNFDIFPLSPTHDEDRCEYANNYRAAGSSDTVYTRVIRTEDETALQYLFFYYLNDWFNVHEGDWELIQLLFPSGSPADIVREQIQPEWVGYSQHTGGRRVTWQDVEKEPPSSTHPVVYVASGSHSNYFRPGFWAADVKYWFDNCDLTVAANDPNARRLPPLTALGNQGYTLDFFRDPAANTQYGWTAFPGKWGQQIIVPSFGGTKSPAVDKAGRNPWWWSEHKLKKGLNEERFCADRENHQRSVNAGHRLLEELVSQSWDVRILVGDLALFFVSWFGSDVTLTLTSPSGVVIPARDAADVMYDKGDTHEVYRITNAEPGDWHLSVVGKDLPPGGERLDWKVFDLPLPCDEIDKTASDRDSDQDGLTNDVDPAPCSWDDDADSIGDGCEVSIDLCTPTPTPPITPFAALDTPTPVPTATPF